MRLQQQLTRDAKREPTGPGATHYRGLLGWILGLREAWKSDRHAFQNQLRLIQTLPLNGKKQLMLIECAGERFLIGGGVDSVNTIVRLHGAGLLAVEEEDERLSCL